MVNDQWSMVNDQWSMVNDQWLILQHWRGGLQVLLVTKNCFIILGRRFVMWWERRIDSLVGGRIDSLVRRRIDSLVGGRIASLVGGRIASHTPLVRGLCPYMCDTTLVLGICWLHFSLFTFHFSPHTQAHSLGYTLHSSLFTLHHIPKLIRLATLFTFHSSLSLPL